MTPRPQSELERATGVPITRLEVIHLEPGDLLVVRSPVTLSAALAAKIQDVVSGKVPNGVKVLVMAGDLELNAYRPITSDDGPGMEP
jgi:hypothetical protein